MRFLLRLTPLPRPSASPPKVRAGSAPYQSPLLPLRDAYRDGSPPWGPQLRARCAAAGRSPPSSAPLRHPFGTPLPALLPSTPSLPPSLPPAAAFATGACSTSSGTRRRCTASARCPSAPRRARRSPRRCRPRRTRPTTCPSERGPPRQPRACRDGTASRAAGWASRRTVLLAGRAGLPSRGGPLRRRPREARGAGREGSGAAAANRRPAGSSSTSRT